MNVIASLVARPEGPADPGPGYYARPTGATLAAHGLPTGIQRRRSDGRFRAVIGHRHTRTFATVEEALAWRRTALAVLVDPDALPERRSGDGGCAPRGATWRARGRGAVTGARWSLIPKGSRVDADPCFYFESLKISGRPPIFGIIFGIP